jgi:hypothetical protein
VFKNRVLKRIFGPKRNEARGGWRKMNNEEVHHILHFSPTMGPNGMRRAGHVARMKKRTAYRLMVGTPEGKRTLGRQRRRRVHKIRMDLGVRELGWFGLD